VQFDAEAPGSLGGALVGDVQPGTPAAEAGLRAGDLVVAAGGRSVRSPQDLIAILGGKSPGDRIDLTILRPRVLDGIPVEEEVTVEAVLGERQR
jgi:S1-C subfamily serine protease